MDRDALDKLARTLSGYGEEAATALANGRDSIRDDARKLVDTANAELPDWANPAMRLASTFLPGTGLMDSMRLAGEAGGQWRDGRYGRALDTMGDAILAPVNDAMFLLPGGGFVKALPK